MQMFVGQPIIVSAVQNKGRAFEWPEAFRMAIIQVLQHHACEIRTGDGPRVCNRGDWVTHGPDGQFSVVRNAAFDLYFQPYAPQEAKEKTNA